jgi:hypothetical protein
LIRQAGLQEGDLVLAIEGQTVHGVYGMVRLPSGERIGQQTEFLVLTLANTIEHRSVLPGGARLMRRAPACIYCWLLGTGASVTSIVRLK